MIYILELIKEIYFNFMKIEKNTFRNNNII